MNILKQSTAATIKLGPFVDDTDGKTAETALTIVQADIRLSKNGGDIAQSNNTAGATHDELGYYDIPLNTTDTGTLGRLRVLVSKAGALPVWQDFLIVTANVFDTFCSTGSLNVNAASLSTDAITAASMKADAVTKIQNGLALQATSLAIKGQTDKIPDAPAQTGEYNAALTAIQSDLDNPAQYKADVSGLATTTHVQEVENKIDAIDITVNTIPTNPLLDTAYIAPDNAGIAAIKEKTEQLIFTAPNKVDANVDVVLSPEAIEDMATAIRDGLPEDIWSSSKRTLTQSPAEIIATVLGADITQIRGNSWAVQLTGVELGSIQQLAIKHSAKQSDSAALLFVDSVNGLTVLNGVAQDGEDSSKASLTYDGTILTLTVDASITAQLPAGSLKYGIQSISNNGIVSEPYGGTFHVLADIVRATD